MNSKQPDWDAVARYIRDALDALGWNQAALVRESGVAQPVVAELMADPPTVKPGRSRITLERLSEALVGDKTALARVLDGDDPLPLPERRAPLAEVLARLAEIEAKIDQIVAGVSSLAAERTARKHVSKLQAEVAELEAAVADGGAHRAGPRGAGSRRASPR